MAGDRFELRLKLFVSAVEALQLALDQPEDEFIRDSVIKRFELAFETARKCLRQWLVEHDEIVESASKKVAYIREEAMAHLRALVGTFGRRP